MASPFLSPSRDWQPHTSHGCCGHAEVMIGGKGRDKSPGMLDADFGDEPDML